MVYFLGQCGHESAGLRYPVEIHDGSNYEGREDLGNTQPGDGVKFAGTGWLQATAELITRALPITCLSASLIQRRGNWQDYSSEKYP